MLRKLITWQSKQVVTVHTVYCKLASAIFTLPLDARNAAQVRSGSQVLGKRRRMTTTISEPDMKHLVSQDQQQPKPNPLHESIFVSDDAPVYDVPMQVIHRPLQSFTDEAKVRVTVLLHKDTYNGFLDISVDSLMHRSTVS